MIGYTKFDALTRLRKMLEAAAREASTVVRSGVGRD